MKKVSKSNIKKFIISVGLLLVSVLLATSICHAFSPAIYDFEKPWNEKGSAQVVLEWIKPEELLQVDLDKEVLNAEDYEVVNYNDGIKLEISEAGLKKLHLKLGKNYIWLKLAGKRDTQEVHTYVILDEGRTEISFDKSDSTEVLRIDNRVSVDELIPVDSSNYNVTESDTKFTIRFDEKYLNSIESREFWIYCLKDRYICLELIKGEMGDVNCDGKVDLIDAKETLKVSLGITESTDELLKLGDVNEDGNISLSDAKNVLFKALGIS